MWMGEKWGQRWCVVWEMGLGRLGIVAIWNLLQTEVGCRELEAHWV